MDTAIALIGDVMLGRLVDELVVGNASVRPRDPWGEVLPLLATVDLRFINLECVISARGHEWRPESKAFHFRARPRAVEFLKAAKVDCVTLANNHVLDYGPEALLDCLNLLDQAGIKRAGAGRNVNEASEPAFVDGPGGPVAVVALTDNEPEWEAGAVIPGTHYVSIDSDGLKEPYRSRLADVMRLAKSRAALVVVGAHVGPNWGAPSRELRAMARDLIDLGADVYWGHSNHTPQGIEIHDGKPILYSTGDFLDDYAVDEHERNDLSFLFILELQGGRITGLRLHPVTIDDCRVRLARDREADFLRRTMVARCAAFGTPLEFDGHVGRIVLA
jgi:poly-gamma-glutamate synthesis protein (capsule biosynthesis protein)